MLDTRITTLYNAFLFFESVLIELIPQLKLLIINLTQQLINK